MHSSRWQDLVVAPEGERHLVQLYRDEGFAVEAVAAWLGPALRGGGGALLACSAPHAEAILGRMAREGVDVELARREDRIVALDGEDLLRAFVRDGAPQPALFKSLVREALDRIARRRRAGSEVRVWGEMVDALAKRGERRAAERLEALWNEVVDEARIRLLCSYELDHLSADVERVVSACAGHARVFTEPDEAAFDAALDSALVAEYGEGEAAKMRSHLAAQRTLHIQLRASESVYWALRRADPAAADRVARRVRQSLAAAAPH